MSNIALKKVTTEQNEQARKNIIEVFKTTGMSKKKFCEMYLAGAAEKTIYCWEMGKAIPRKSTIKLFSSATGIPESTLYKESLSNDQIKTYLKNAEEPILNKSRPLSSLHKEIAENHTVYKKIIIKNYQELTHNDQIFACSYITKLLQYDGIAVANHITNINDRQEKIAAICELMTPGILELACCLILHLKKNTAGSK